MRRFVFTTFVLLLALCGVRAQDDAKPQPKDSVVTVSDNHAVVKPFTHIDYKPLVESSGLQFWQGAWWSHNDSGGAAVLYRAETPDFKGARPCDVSGARAVDWEEITVIGDDLLVCDIGNNRRSRDDLMLYRVSWDAKAAELKTKASYPVAYPDGNHDAEAAAVIDGKLVVVSKNRGEGYTGVYRFNELKEGKANTAELVGKLDIDEHTMVTAADYDSKHKKLILLSYTRIFVYGEKLEGKPERSLLIYAQQCESLCLHDGALYYGNEPGEIFKIDGFLDSKYDRLLPKRVNVELPVGKKTQEPDGTGESWKDGAYKLPLKGLHEGEYLRWKVCGAYLMLAGRFDYDAFTSSNARGNRLGSSLLVMVGRKRGEFLSGDEAHLWLGDNGITGVDAWKLDTEKFHLSVLQGAKCRGSVKAKRWTFEYAIPLTEVFGEGELPKDCAVNVWGYNLHGEHEPHLAGDTIVCLGNPYVWAQAKIGDK
jgi:hypothetical protein